jgi:CrcB protein
MLVVGVMVGGALGALSRYLTTTVVQGLVQGNAWASFPLATLLVNVVGSFMLALLTEMGLRGWVAPAWRVAIGTGFLGALTTFSTFELESHLLVRQGELLRAGLYIAANLVLGYLAIVLGRALALRLAGVG